MILTRSPEPLPLRGYDIYADDLPVIAGHVGKECQLVYWQRGLRGSAHETTDFDRLSRPDVAGFLVAGDFTLSLERDPRPFSKSRCNVTVQDAASLEVVLDAIAAMRARRMSFLPWRAYDCRFIPRAHSEHRMRAWIIAGAIGALVPACAAVLAFVF